MTMKRSRGGTGSRRLGFGSGSGAGSGGFTRAFVAVVAEADRPEVGSLALLREETYPLSLTEQMRRPAVRDMEQELDHLNRQRLFTDLGEIPPLRTPLEVLGRQSELPFCRLGRARYLTAGGHGKVKSTCPPSSYARRSS
jgi:hypothetical protein